MQDSCTENLSSGEIKKVKITNIIKDGVLAEII